MKKQITWIEQSSKEVEIVVEIFPPLAKKRTQMVFYRCNLLNSQGTVNRYLIQSCSRYKRKEWRCLFYETGVILIPKTDEIIQENISTHLYL